MNVVIRFHFSNFAQAKTASGCQTFARKGLWFAFILVILRKRKQLEYSDGSVVEVVIRFHFSNFAQAKTANMNQVVYPSMLWFAFILVILRKRKQQKQ